MKPGVSLARNLDVMGAAAIAFGFLFCVVITAQGWMVLHILQQPRKGSGR